MLDNSIRSACLIILAISLSNLSLHGSEDQALPLNLLEEGRFEEAFEILKSEALSDDHRRAFIIALMHVTGAGVLLDEEEAQNWMEQSANAGNLNARFEARWTHAVPPILPQNDSENFIPPILASATAQGLVFHHHAAIAWNLQAAKLNNLVALHNLAKYTLLAPNLIGATRSDYSARLIAAAEAGSIPAIRLIIKEDTNEASEWTFDPEVVRSFVQYGADAGDARVQYYLGNTLDATAAESDNREEARRWLKLAANQNYQAAIDLLAVLERKYLTDQERTAQQVEQQRKLLFKRVQQLITEAETGGFQSRPAMTQLANLSREDEGILLAYGRFLFRNPHLRLPEPDDFISRLIAARDTGNVAAGGLAGRLLIQGRVELFRDVSRGEQLLEEAMRNGDENVRSFLSMAALQNDKTLDLLATNETPVNAPYYSEQIAKEEEENRRTHWAENPTPSEVELQGLIAQLARPVTRTYPPEQIFQPGPFYPWRERTAGIEGRVWVTFTVDTDGKVYDVKPTHSTHAGFERDAVEAVTRWRFVPSRKNGELVESHMRVPIVFTIED